MKTITLTEAQHRLHTIAESEGNVVRGGENVSCMYFSPDGVPSCLVGRAFEAELRELGVEYGNWLNEDNVLVLRDNGLSIEDDALEYLTDAQSAQDSGDTWSQAVAKADEHIAGFLALAA